MTYPFQTNPPNAWARTDAAMWLVYELTESIITFETLLNSQSMASVYIEKIERLHRGRYDAKLAACRRLLLSVR